METITLVSSDSPVVDQMAAQIPDFLRRTALVTQTRPGPALLDYLKYEIPDLVILHATGDPTQFVHLFSQLETDPWLDSIGIVLIVPDVEAVIEAYQGFNIAYFLNESELTRNLGRVLTILDDNRDLLNYDTIIKRLTALSGELTLPTDLLLIQYYSALFSNYLFKEGLVDRTKKYSVKLVLEELMTNAMEHGNAGMTFETKSQLLEAGVSLQDFVEQRMSRPPWRGRTVTLSYSIGPLESRFTIADQGDGFDVSALPDPRSEGLATSHGRGVFLSRHSSDGLEYNSKGNEVTVRIAHNGSAERTIPPGFIQNEPRTLAPDEVVFREGTTGDHLYYIVSGEYEVFVGETRIARLTPSDVFMGEMSFLLGNRRTATVVAATSGKLVEISRQAFTDAVKQYPNYGIFLSKMLARRLRDNNRRYAS